MSYASNLLVKGSWRLSDQMHTHCRVDRSEWWIRNDSVSQSIRYVGIELLGQLKRCMTNAWPSQDLKPFYGFIIKRLYMILKVLKPKKKYVGIPCKHLSTKGLGILWKIQSSLIPSPVLSCVTFLDPPLKVSRKPPCETSLTLFVVTLIPSRSLPSESPEKSIKLRADHPPPSGT